MKNESEKQTWEKWDSPERYLYSQKLPASLYERSQSSWWRGWQGRLVRWTLAIVGLAYLGMQPAFENTILAPIFFGAAIFLFLGLIFYLWAETE